MSGSTVQILAAAAGWFAAAALGYLANTFLDRRRWEHERRGTRRQMRTLLRRVLAVIDPFFWSFKNLQLNDSIVTYQQMLEQLGDRQTAVALTDTEYDAMDSLLARYGQMVALVQSHWNDLNEKAMHEPNVTDGVKRQRSDDLRRFSAQAFQDALHAAEDAVNLFADDDMKTSYAEMSARADKFVEQKLAEASDPYRY